MESECRLQLSNLLKVFTIKYESTSFQEQFSLKEYLQQFADTSDCTRNEKHQFDVEYYIDILHDVSLPNRGFSNGVSHLYSWISVFSYSKKYNGCQFFHEFLTTDNYLEVNNDIGSEYSLIELIDRGCLEYPSPLVIKSVSTLYEIFQIDRCDRLNKEFYSGPIPINACENINVCYC